MHKEWYRLDARARDECVGVRGIRMPWLGMRMLPKMNQGSKRFFLGVVFHGVLSKPPDLLLPDQPSFSLYNRVGSSWVAGEKTLGHLMGHRSWGRDCVRAGFESFFISTVREYSLARWPIRWADRAWRSPASSCKRLNQLDNRKSEKLKSQKMKTFLKSTFFLAISYILGVVSLLDWLLNSTFPPLVPVTVSSGRVFPWS